MSRKPRSGSRIYEGIALIVDAAGPAVVERIADEYGAHAGKRAEGAVQYLAELVAWYEASTGKVVRSERPEGGPVAALDRAPASTPAERPAPVSDPLAPVGGGAFRLGDVPIIVRGINEDGSVRVRWCGGTERTVTASAWRRDVANLPADPAYADIARTRVL